MSDVFGLAESPAGPPAALASWALEQELLTTPKPGLVSPADCGAHADMDAQTFRASIASLSGYFPAVFAAGVAGAGMDELRRLGLAAEQAMLRATGGVNTHRGAIFSLGLLVAAAGARSVLPPAEARMSLGAMVQARWGPAIAVVPSGADSHGLVAARRHGVSGARGEAAAGFPHVYEAGLPALRGSLAHGWNAAKLQCLFAILAELGDTNLLHRGGGGGLAFARDEARRFLADGGVASPDWLSRAAAIHRRFIERRLSPGGAGDLLAAALFVHAADRQQEMEA